MLLAGALLWAGCGETPSPSPESANAPTAVPVIDYRKSGETCHSTVQCPDGETCVSISALTARCRIVADVEPVAVSRGRPMPPLGLLTGDGMRSGQ